MGALALTMQMIGSAVVLLAAVILAGLAVLATVSLIQGGFRKVRRRGRSGSLLRAVGETCKRMIRRMGNLMAVSSVGVPAGPYLMSTAAAITGEVAAPPTEHPIHPGRMRQDLAGECAAFLAGRCPPLTDGPARRPAWAYVNAVAHLDGASLDRLAREPDASSALGAVSYVAEDVLLFCQRHQIPLSRLQRDVLVPLELDLTDRAMTRLPEVIHILDARLAHYVRRGTAVAGDADSG